jgi:hypothetical protein
MQANTTTVSSKRTFVLSPVRSLRVKEISEQDMNGLTVKQHRLMEDLHHTCQWGTGQRWGKYVCITYENDIY